MDNNVLTRQMYCERCAKAQRPHRDSRFVVCGDSGFHLRQVDRFVPHKLRGFTPHLVSAYKMLDDKTLAYSRVCCLVGCGVTLQQDPKDRNKIVFAYRKVSYEQMLVTDWNALVGSKDLGYKI